MYNLYTVGCFVSLGFYMASDVHTDKSLSEKIFVSIMGGVVAYFLSWASVIYYILREVKKETK